MGPEPPPEDVQAAIDRAATRLGVFAGRLLWYPRVTSTNDFAARFAAAGADEGTTVAAEEQTHGRGRLGRQWASPPGAGIYVSTVLRPSAAEASLLTIGVGVALSEGIEAATGLSTTLKWPNDLYSGSRKLGGILAEAGTTGGAIEYAVVGFGVNLGPGAYPPDVASRATSVESEIGRAVDRGLVLAECLAAISARYAELRAGGGPQILQQWRRRAAGTFGRAVEWDSPAGVREGIAEDLDERGALIVRCGADRVGLLSGEVRWKA